MFLARKIRDKKRKIRLETTLSQKWENAFSGNLMGIALPIPSQIIFLSFFENNVFQKMRKIVFGSTVPVTAALKSSSGAIIGHAWHENLKKH